MNKLVVACLVSAMAAPFAAMSQQVTPLSPKDQLELSFSAGAEAALLSDGWHCNKHVSETFASTDSQNAWAYIDGEGWKELYNISESGETETLSVLNGARYNGYGGCVLMKDDQIHAAQF